MGIIKVVVKCLLLFFNTILAILSMKLLDFTLTLTKAWVEIDNNDEIKVVASFPLLFFALVLLLAFSSVLYGYVGVFGDRRGAIRKYAELLFLLLAICILGGVFALSNLPSLREFVDVLLRELWEKREKYAHMWDILQTDLHCCGLKRSVDWLPQTPASCCAPYTSECIGILNAYSVSCSTAIKSIITSNTDLAPFLVALSAFLVFGLVFATYLWHLLRERRQCDPVEMGKSKLYDSTSADSYIIS